MVKVTRLIPDAKGTSCNQRLERISGTQHTYILRVPFRNENGILKKWISRFDVWPYLEKFAEVTTIISSHYELLGRISFSVHITKENPESCSLVLPDISYCSTMTIVLFSI